MRNPPEEWNSARNYRKLDKGSTGRMDFCWELPAHGHGFRPAKSIIFRSATFQGTLTHRDIYLVRLIFKKSNIKTSLK
jgi:hypothetical protein